MEKIFTIIGGVNGAGKSSFTGVLKESRKDLGRIIDVDMITAQLGRVFCIPIIQNG